MLQVYIAPDGSDANPGTEEEPFATLTHARDAVRLLKAEHPGEDVIVYLRGGVYRLADTVVFTSADSGNPGQTITYAAYPGETPILSSGIPVRGWRKLDEGPPELPPQARGRVWVADVSFVRELKQRQAPSPTVAGQMDAGWRFFTLYRGDKRLPRAASEPFSLRNDPELDVSDYRTFAFPGGMIRNWPGLADVELALIPEYIWISNFLPIERVDEEAGVARTAVPGTYRLLPPPKMDYTPTARVENALAWLDKPGEWVLDTRSALLYLWPEEGEPGDDILIPLLTELIRVEGEIDYAGPEDIPVRNLVFRSLTFTHGDRFPWHGRSGWGLQHDWERFDSPSALLRFRGAEDCMVEDCHFTTAGGAGVRFDLHARRNRIEGNHFQHLGGVGVLLAGYGPGTKDVNRQNVIANNLVHDIGELYLGSPAIFVWQSGENRIEHNHIYDTPYTGVCVTGRIVMDPEGVEECSRTIRWPEVGEVEAAQRWRNKGEAWNREETWAERQPYLHARNNLVYRNEIHDVTQVTGDGNFIYVSGCGAGNVVLENYCHDAHGLRMHAAIRCDDDQNATLIKRNIIYRCHGGRGEGIISKGRNDIIENIVADLEDVARHRGYLAFPYSDVSGSTVRGNIFYSRKKGQLVCGEGDSWVQRPSTRLQTTHADYNLYFCTEDPGWGERHLRAMRPHGIETHSLAAAPVFYDLDRGDFRFRPGSPALKLGIEQPLSLDEMGMLSPYYERWQDDAEGRRYPLAEAVECRPRGGLANFFRKLETEKEVGVAYLGGSITAHPGWRVKTTAWFRQEFPQTSIREINAAIGGTGSDLAMHRLRQDVLDHTPDMLFVEFAVNDSDAPPRQIHKTMENIVRQTWRHDPEIDICFVYTLSKGMLADLQGGRFPRAASAMEMVADRYGIPSIHMGLAVARLEQSGQIIFEAPEPESGAEMEALNGRLIFSSDGVHPYADTGHRLYCEAIRRSMKQMRRIGNPAPHSLPGPIFPHSWERARMIPISRARLSAGWRRVALSNDLFAEEYAEKPTPGRFADFLPELFVADWPGESISFSFRGAGVELYDLVGPDSCQVTIQLDDYPPRVLPRFDAYATWHRLARLTIARRLPDARHHVRIEIHPHQPDKAQILRAGSQGMDDPQRFDGAVWYVGALLLLGELVD
jgi:lysophospholipase L1-like esterase